MSILTFYSLVTYVQVVISLVVIAMYAYVVFVHFSVDGPLWEAFAWSAGEAPLFFVPLCAVLMMRADIISIYSEEPSGDTAGSGDLSTNLLGLDIV